MHYGDLGFLLLVFYFKGAGEFQRFLASIKRAHPLMSSRRKTAGLFRFIRANF